MLSVISNCWALLLGMGLIMLGNGLQGTLLGVRASMEGFSTTVTGLMMSGYFIGLILGCLLVPKFVQRVGHIRMFGALASLASTSILIQAVFVDPWVWWVMRVITGLAYSGTYVVAESWLNEASEPKSRGQLLSIYSLITIGGMAGGQFLLNVALPSGFELFALVSLLVSLAVIPILTSVAKAPTLDAQENVSILQLYKVSPLGIFGMFVVGMAMGAVFGMGPVYATDVGMFTKEVSFFMGSIIFGGFLFQYPLGWLSYRYGRRTIIIVCCITGAAVAFFAMKHQARGAEFYAIMIFVGGLSMPLYALCGAHTNDYLTPQQMVAASGTLVLVNAIGATIGAPMAALAMDNFGPNAFFGAIGVMMSSAAVFALWRTTQRAAVDADERGDFVVMAGTMSVSFAPDVELEDIEAAAEFDAEEVQTSFEELVDELDNPDSFIYGESDDGADNKSDTNDKPPTDSKDSS